jgi:thiamine biosynthesis lipoprotein
MSRVKGLAYLARAAVSCGRLGMASAVALLASVHAAGAQTRFEFTAVHMGVPVRVVLYGRDSVSARDAARAAYNRVAELDRIMSDYQPRSEVRLLTGRPREWVPVSEDLFAVLARALEIAAMSDGAFDPTVGPFSRLWRETRRSGQLPDEATLAQARARVGWRLVQADSTRRAIRLAVDDMWIDLGGIAKGYILQKAMEVLKDRGASVAMIEAGGDVVVGDPPPGAAGWSIAVPQADPAFSARAAVLTNAAIATSGSSEQFVEIAGVRYSHVVDPRTGLGVSRPHAVSVIATDGATADAVATAMGVLGSAGEASMGRLVIAIAQMAGLEKDLKATLLGLTHLRR